MPNLPENINSVNARIASAAKNAHRTVTGIQLLAVSKGQPVEAIKAAYQCGLRHFGENYLQEALDKIMRLNASTDIEWHFIGPVQSNKTRKLAENFDWLHTIDRIKVAERLSTQRPTGLPPLNVCLQVNIDDESSKSGIAPDALPELALAVAKLPGLKLRGLMAIPRTATSMKTQRQPFARLAELLKQLQNLSTDLATLDTLSMGMSGDMEAAIAEGATIVRVGTDIFGSRQTQNHH